MSPERAAMVVCIVVVLMAIVACIVSHEERRDRRLDRYRPTHDNRHPHRDEFKAFMRDVK